MREGKSRLATAFWPLGLGGVLITVAIIALYTPWLPIFDLREVVVSGNRETTALDVAQAANLRGGVGLLSVSRSATAKRVATLPWVQRVRVRWSLPHRVKVEVFERAPVARVPLANGGCALVAEGGVVVAAECGGRDEVLLLKGVAMPKAAPGDRLPNQEAVPLLDALQRVRLQDTTVREVVVSKDNTVELVTTGETRVRLGALGDAAGKVRSLEALCRAVKTGQYELIDLRFGGEATLVPRVRR